MTVNPIVNFNDKDFVVWGSETLNREPTALDKVSIRRLVFYTQKRIRRELRSLSFSFSEYDTFDDYLDAYCEASYNFIVETMYELYNKKAFYHFFCAKQKTRDGVWEITAGVCHQKSLDSEMPQYVKIIFTIAKEGDATDAVH